MSNRHAISVRHATRLLASLNDLRTSEWVCDYQIKASDSVFLVHRAVLAAFSHNFKETMEVDGLDEIDLPVSENTAREFIKFIYTGEATVTLNNCEQLLLMATTSDSKELGEVCSIFLNDQLSTTNCFQIRRICKNYQPAQRVAEVDKFVVSNFDSVAATDGFLHLEMSELSECLNEINLHAEQLWNAIRFWINFDKENRKAHLYGFLTTFKSRFPIQLTIKDILQHPLVAESEPSKYVLRVQVFSDLELLKSSVTVDNFSLLDDWSQHFPHHNSRAVRKLVAEFMVNNFKAIKNEEYLIDLTYDNIHSLYEALGPRKGIQRAMWDVLLKWTNHDVFARGRFFPRLFQLINIKLFEPSFLNDVVRNDELVKNWKCCTERVMDAFVFHCQSSPQPVKKRRKTDTVAGPKGPKEQTFIAAYMRGTGQLLGYDVNKKGKSKSGKGMKGKVLLGAKPSSEPFQAAVNLDSGVYVMKGREMSLRTFKPSERNTWRTRKGPDSTPTPDAKMVVFQKKIYIVQSGSFLIYDPETDKWLPSCAVPEVSGSLFCVCATDSHLYILGGDNTPFRALRCNPDSIATDRTIEAIGLLKQPRKDSATVAAGGKVYVLGGCDFPDASKSMEYYDSKTQSSEWILIHAKMKFDRWGFAACAHENKIFAVGGRKPTEISDNIEVFDVQEDSKHWGEFLEIVNFQTPFCAWVMTKVKNVAEKTSKHAAEHLKEDKDPPV